MSLLVLSQVCASTAGGEEPLAAFLRQKWAECSSTHRDSLNAEVARFCAQWNLDATAAKTAQALGEIGFLHALFTASGAVDFATGGILGIPYLWHWVTPNPRHSVLHLPDSIPLGRLPPPAEFERYKSYADVDRIPSLYLAELVSETPRYFHPEIGAFHTFGWCSEREMAFNTLLAVLGYTCKVKQEGHTWAEVLVALQGADGNEALFAAEVDNTFDRIGWTPVTVPEATWRSDLGSGTRVRWYNQVSHSPEEIEAIRSLGVGPRAAERISAQVAAWPGR